MIGFWWTAGIWAAGAAGLYLFDRERARRLLTRENLALMLALLGTYAISTQTEADEVLREPVVLERVVRGGMAALALLLATPVLITRLQRSRRVGARATTAFVAYMGIALVSAGYSVARLVSAAKVFEMAAALVAVLAIAYGPAARERLRDTFGLVLGSQFLLLAVAVVGFFALPDIFAFLESRPGFVTATTLFPPYAHSNAVSATAAALGVYAVAKLVSDGHKPMWAAMTVVSLAGVVLASGRQGVAVFLVGSLVVLWTRRRNLLIFLIVPALVVTFLTYQDEILLALARDRPSNFATLTGRTVWWEAALSVWTDHPWLGWGFSAGGRFVALESLAMSGVSSVHSGYVEALVGVGLIGMIPFVYVLWRVTAWSLTRLRLGVDVAIAALIVPLAIRTGVSLGFGGWLTTELVLFLLLAVISDQDVVDSRSPRPVATPVAAR